jgi:hypothetical protein
MIDSDPMRKHLERKRGFKMVVALGFQIPCRIKNIGTPSWIPHRPYPNASLRTN